MSSAFPTSDSNVVGGLGFLGCNQHSESLESPSAVEAESLAARDTSIVKAAEGDRQVDEIQIAPQSASASRPCVVAPSPFHRVAQVRETQGFTERTIAKRMGVDIRTYRQLECPTTDLTLSQLNAFQKALEVPLVDLLEDRQHLSRPVEERAKLVKIMKTASAMQKKATPSQMKRMADTLCGQLIDLMPELEEVSSWPQFGARRGQSAIGRALTQQINMSDLSIE